MAWVKSGLAFAFCALALTCMVMYMTQEDNFGVVKEHGGSEAPVDASMVQSQGKKKINAWRQFYAAKKLLPKIKKASPATFKKVTSACRSLKAHAYTQCGKFYCVKRAACSNPCKDRYGQPVRQVIPLIGNKFYKVQRVSVKEKRAKERNQKELAQKQAAILKIREHAKHLIKKEADEEERRTKADVVSRTAEKVRKGKLVIAQRRAKMAKAKKEKGYHNAVVIKCTKRSQAKYLGCVQQRLKEQKVKASEKKYKYEQEQEKIRQKKKKHLAWLKQLMEKKTKAAAAQYASTSKKMEQGLKAYASAQKLRKFAKQAGGNAAAVYQSGTLKTEQSYASSVVPLPAGTKTKPAAAISFSNVFTEAVPTSVTGAKMGELQTEHALAAYASGKPGAAAARAALKKAARAFKALAVEEDRLKYATIKYDQDRSTMRVAEIELEWHKKELKKCDAQLDTLNTYIQTHRAILHTNTCKHNKKYHFNVCYSRATYRAKLRHTAAIKKDTARLNGFKAQFKASKMLLRKAQKSEAKAVARVKQAQAGSRAANAAALKATAEANERREKHLSKLLKLKQKKKAAAVVKQQQKALAFARQLAGRVSTKKNEFTQLSASDSTAKWTCKRGHDHAWKRCTSSLDEAYQLCAGMFRNSARI